MTGSIRGQDPAFKKMIMIFRPRWFTANGFKDAEAASFLSSSFIVSAKSVFPHSVVAGGKT